MTQPSPPTTTAETPAAATTLARRRRGYFLPGAIALAALLAIGAAIGSGDLSHPAPRTLTGSEVASQISLGLQAQRNSSQPPRVTCPASEPVRVDLRFQCTLDATAGQPASPVTVTEVDGRGRLRWTLGVTHPPT